MKVSCPFPGYPLAPRPCPRTPTDPLAEFRFPHLSDPSLTTLASWASHCYGLRASLAAQPAQNSRMLGVLVSPVPQ
ncbi:hypothetical protein J6590_012336 [Homalodisca vitripennis]|nr:hypothetical protein J6590_012336 [Homalodisca vitripennis]